MQMQAPTLTTTTRPPLFVVIAALVVAAIVAGAIALATHGDSSTSAIAPAKPASAPAVTISSQSGLARVWDGTPILRSAGPAVPHSGGGPSVQSHAQFPVRPPEGFHRVP